MQLHNEDFAALDALGKEENARISEIDFTKRLLPHLIPPEVTESRPRDLTIWLEAAGNAQRLIDVIGKNGEVLFTVPPILSRSPTAVPSKETNPENDLGEVGAIYDARIGTEPAHVVNEWYFNSLVQRSYSPEQSLIYLYARMWITIYRRYNIPLERMFGENAEVIGQKVPGGEKVAVKDKDDFSNEALEDDDFEAM
jgi:hypothetical protein